MTRSADENDCWIWTGCIFKATGYGSCCISKRQMGAHRMAWILARGPIPDGLEVLHDCDVRRCCNPAHLFLGTQKDNIEDAMGKGRNPKGDTHGFRKLSSSDVAEIRKAYKFRSVTYKLLALRYDVSVCEIGRVIRGEAWRP